MQTSRGCCWDMVSHCPLEEKVFSIREQPIDFACWLGSLVQSVERQHIKLRVVGSSSAGVHFFFLSVCLSVHLPNHCLLFLFPPTHPPIHHSAPLLSTLLHASSSHFWVIVLLLSDAASQSLLTMSPSQAFPDNDTFQSYSASPQPNTPYVVSEMSAGSYQSLASGVFYLGDENRTRAGNDFPELYRNGPLVAGRRYSVFVWAFVHSIPSQSSSLVRREGGREGGKVVKWIRIESGLGCLHFPVLSSPPPPSPLTPVLPHPLPSPSSG